MSPSAPDILYLADPHHPGLFSRGMAEEVRAAAKAGYRSALVPLRTRTPTGRWPVARPVRELVREGLLDLVAPDAGRVEARLLLLPDPAALAGPPPKIEVRTEAAIAVVSQPIMDRHGRPRFDLAEAEHWTAAVAGRRPEWAPAWRSVRSEIEGLWRHVRVLEADWPQVIDTAWWRRGIPRPRDGRPVVGRHSRPLRDHWPEDLRRLLVFFPGSGEVDVRLLGVPAELVEPFGDRPRGWGLIAPDNLRIERFLDTIDFFVHARHPIWEHWVEPGIVEALAAGVVPVLPERFEAEFGDGAVYASPAQDGRDILRQVVTLHRDPDAYREQVARGDARLRHRHDPADFVARLAERIGPPRTSATAVPAAAPPGRDGRRKRGDGPRTVLFVATNGIGIGHVAQALAVARHLPGDVRPVFACMSQAIGAVRRFGHPVEFFAPHEYLECDSRRWNAWTALDLERMIAFYGARAVVFSGVFPYAGVVAAAGNRPDCPLAWLRIPLWKKPLWREATDRAIYFDAVIDTGELAAERNLGAVAAESAAAHVVPPVILPTAEDLLSREEARRALDLDPGRPAALIQLGAGNNVALHPVVDHMLDVLGSDFQIVVAEWLIADRPFHPRPGVRMLRDFPNARYLRAFDFSVTACGYGTFHEAIAFAVPTIFVPNEHMGTDDQLARAVYAEENGLGFCLRLHEAADFGRLVARIMDAGTRERLVANCRRRFVPGGAAEAARIVAELLDR